MIKNKLLLQFNTIIDNSFNDFLNKFANVLEELYKTSKDDFFHRNPEIVKIVSKDTILLIYDEDGRVRYDLERILMDTEPFLDFIFKINQHPFYKYSEYKIPEIIQR